MGLPMYKPKDEEDFVFKNHQAKDEMEDDSWPVFPHQSILQLHNYGNNRRPSHRSSSSSGGGSSNHNNNNSSSSNRNNNPNFQPRISRITRRRSMLTSSLPDRRRDARVHQSPGSVATVTPSSPSSSATLAVTSPPMRSELHRRLHRRITEKEDLLEQLRVTVSLLDQFLSARAALGRDMSWPSFITEDLPAVLESASSLAAMSPSLLTSSSSLSSTVLDVTANTEVTTLQEMVDRLLQVPPYSIQIQQIEQNILSAHRRIREQLSVLGSSPQDAVAPSQRSIYHPPVVRGESQPTTATRVATGEPRITLGRLSVDEESNNRSNIIYGSDI